MFPLLLVFVTVLGFVISGDKADQTAVLDGALGQSRSSGAAQANSLTGSPLALAIGVRRLAARRHGDHEGDPARAQPRLEIPRQQRPDFLQARCAGSRMLLVLAVLSCSRASRPASSRRLTWALTDVAAIAVAFAANVALFLAAFKLLSAAEVDLGDLMPG